MIIVDTDVMIDVLRGYYPAKVWLESLDRETVILPGLVAMELIKGCRNKKEIQVLLKEFASFQVYWPLPPTCNRALRILTSVHLSHGIGINDMLIGQMAVDLAKPLCTFNQKHYTPIPDLKTIQPYIKE